VCSYTEWCGVQLYRVVWCVVIQGGVVCSYTEGVVCSYTEGVVCSYTEGVLCSYTGRFLWGHINAQRDGPNSS
jgi:hypothetical protein